jgi:8-oxo-dGTP pyrophosphatase MutT (NUDIX family)
MVRICVPSFAELIDQYRPSGDAEAADVARMRALAGGTPDPWSRSEPLHVTASVVIVHAATRRVLLRWHQRQQAWLQVGGHGDRGETDPLFIAMREAEEETGLTDLQPWPNGELRHVVVVAVPANDKEPAHEHADLRFVFATHSPDRARPENPDSPLRWLPRPEAEEVTAEDNLRETLRRVGELFARSPETSPWDVPEAARRLHEQGRMAGAHGDQDRALELFAQAHALAPDWPYPIYDAAFAHVLKQDNTMAEARYAEVDRMAPRGFFTCKTSLDCLRRERAGRLFPGFCHAFATLEWYQDKTKKRAILEGIVAKYPDYPPAWYELSRLLYDPDACLTAIANGLDGNPDAQTRGMLLLGQAAILDRLGDRAEAVAILSALSLDPASTLGTEALAKAELQRLLP